MMASKLIIGANSKIVREISNQLEDFDFVSHTAIDAINFSKYQFIFLFSWSFKSLQMNIRNIELVPPEKLVFISSVAVFSALSRKQFARYPKDKLHAEKIAFGQGSRILRIGMWNSKFVQSVYNKFFSTGPNKLVSTLNNYSNDSDVILNCLDVESGSKSDLRYFFGLLTKVSKLLPNSTVFQAPIYLLLRFMNIREYGYSHDTTNLITKNLVVGNGVLGSRVMRDIKANVTLVSTNCQNVSLNNDGFANSLIGLTKFGLSSLWHRVCVIHEPPLLRKTFVKRRDGFSKSTLNAMIVDIDLNKKIALAVQVPDGEIIKNFDTLRKYIEKSPPFPIHYETIFLAAGPIMNIFILRKYLKLPFLLSDHEILKIGTTNYKDLPPNCVKIWGPFVKFNSFSVCDVDGLGTVLLDFRPNSSWSRNKNIYLNSTTKILFKLLSSGSLSKINEAVYNRLGFAFKTQRMALYIQVLSEKSISFDGSNFIRSRLPASHLLAITNKLSEFHKTLLLEHEIHTMDAQHIVGKLSEPYGRLSEAQKDGSIVICGTPTRNYDLKTFHHTEDLRGLVSEALIDWKNR